MRALNATPENIHGVLSQSAGLDLAPDTLATDMNTDMVAYRLNRTVRTGYFALRAGSNFTLFRPQPDAANDGQFVTQINLHERRRILKDHFHPLYFDVEAADTPKDLIARGAAAVIGGSYNVTRAEEIRALLEAARELAVSEEMGERSGAVSAKVGIFPNR